MNIVDKRFRISSLIKLARTTSNMRLREEWVLEAKGILDQIESDSTAIDNDYWEDFISEHFERDPNARIRRQSVYETYLKYCEENHDQAVSRNNLYQQLRERGVSETYVNGIRYFRLKEMP